MKSFFRELRRRRVPQVLGLYLGFGWVVVEVADTTFPRLGLPDWTVTFFLVIVILGLPVALVLAWFYDISGDGIRRTPPAADVTRAQDPPPARWRTPLRWLAGIAAIAAVAWLVWPEPEAAPEEGTVAVLPFRVSGELDHLREGMVDLLSTKLSGEVGPRAIDPRLTLRHWRAAAGGADLSTAEATAVARRAGAAQMLTGDVVSAGGSVTLAAVLAPTHPAGPPPVRASVTGPADSVLHLVDRLAGELLGLGAGLESERLVGLTSASLDAVVAYLQGLQAYRAGQFEEAADHFGRAVDADSTFAMAAHYQNAAMGWGFVGAESRRAAALAWRYRGRLNRLDRARVEARFGPLGPGGGAGPPERMAAVRQALRVVPDDPEVWHELGDLIFHFGLRDHLSDDPAEESRRAFLQAAELDPTFSPPFHHLIELAALYRDTAAVRRYYRHFAAGAGLETSGVVAPGYVAGLALGDSAILARFQPRLEDVSAGIAGYTVFAVTMAGLPLDGLLEVFRARLETAVTNADRVPELGRILRIELRAGRTTAMIQTFDRLRDGQWGFNAAYTAFISGVVLDGDSARAMRVLEHSADAAPTAGDALRIRLLLARARATHGDTAGARALVREALRATDGTDADPYARAMALTLDAMIRVLDGAPDAPAAAVRADSFFSHAPALSATARPEGILTVARLYDALGQPEKALETARRLSLKSVVAPAHWLLRARLAARLGHRDEAILQYRLYLTVRAGAEPGTRAFRNLESARREFQAILSTDRPG